MGRGESRMEGFPEPVRHLVLVLYTPDIHDRSNNDTSVIPEMPDISVTVPHQNQTRDCISTCW